jgi:diguanylate cyclase (GGDEF)-like protein
MLLSGRKGTIYSARCVVPCITECSDVIEERIKINYTLILMGTQKNSFVTTCISGYALLVLGAFALSPLVAIVYLHFNQAPSLHFEQASLHMATISAAISLGAIVCYVTWLCYRDSGEVFLRWLTLGFLGFVLIYTPHGVFTFYADANPWLFLLYGPVSRLVMAACFLAAMYFYGSVDDTPKQRMRKLRWLIAISVFLLIDILVAAWALSMWRAVSWPRVSLEYLAIGLYAIAIALMIKQRVRSPLMVFYAIALAWFAQSSLSFIFARPWDHQWWLAHFIFASGFLLLSYGVAQAYISTRSFSRVYSQAMLLEQLRQEKGRTDQALIDLRQANDQLEKLAAADPLTGVANRREFLRRMVGEMARSIRANASLSLLLIDLDHFKKINDNYSHHVGDEVLLEFARLVEGLLRPGDLLGRIGGEEFTVLLTDSDLEQAKQTAERLRQAVEHHEFVIDDYRIRITISIGVAQFHPPNDTDSELLHNADMLLYRAKQRGRNRVEAE